MSENHQMFRWGILSAAPIAIEQLIPAIQKSTNGSVVAIASRNIARATDIARRFNIPTIAATYEDLLTRDDIDGVYIATPTAHHVEWALKAAEMRKHALVEKPIAMHASNISRLIDASKKHNILISEAFMVHYHPQWKKVRSLIAEGAIGKLRHVQGAFTYFKKDASSTRNQLNLGGGSLRDIGVYPTIGTRLATGQEPIQVHATIDIDPDFKTDRYAMVNAQFKDFDLSFYCSTQMALRQSMVFHGESGSIEMLAPFNPLKYNSASIIVHDVTRQSAKTFHFGDINQYQLQCEAFASAALGQSSEFMSLQESYNNQRVIDAAFESGRLKSAIKI